LFCTDPDARHFKKPMLTSHFKDIAQFIKKEVR
jgi:hypothetical protein